MNLFGGNMDELLTGYFVLFIASALFNGFNVRDEGFSIFNGLKENPGFLKVFFAIIIVQALIVNSGSIPLAPFQFIGIVGWITVYILAFTMIPVDLLRKVVMGTYKNA